MKKICALTMVRNNEFFLRRWVAWYGAQLGRENLYVYLDGTDQILEGNYQGVHITFCEHVDDPVLVGDRRRIDFLSSQAAELLKTYDMVIGTDVDEFLVPDPALHLTLAAFLDRQKEAISYSALGIDVGQHMQNEAPFDESRPFLGQRRFAVLSSRYSKASVLAAPVAWGSGFHRVRKHNFHILPDLYLFHFGCADYNRFRALFDDNEHIRNGWGGHLARRVRTIDIVTRSQPRMWEQTVKRARNLQNIFRQWQAWNKPSMIGHRWVVEIPERFRGIV